MELRNRNILIVSPESWSHLHVSKHHYAIELAQRGNTVFFLNPPSKIFQLYETEYDNLKVIDYKGFLRGLHFLPKRLRVWDQQRTLSKIEKLIDEKIDIVWSFDNSVFYDFEVFGKQVFKISHIVDLNQDFQTVRAARSADLCLGVIPEIVNRLGNYNPKSFLIPHGVKIPHDYISNSLPGRNKMKAVYAGNLDMPFVDWSMLEDTVNDHKDVDFIFIGNMASMSLRAKQNVFLKDNCYHISQVDSNVLFGYLMAADILMVAYTPEYYQKYASPHKIKEYLATGKPLVITDRGEYTEEREVIAIGQTSQEWRYMFNESIQNYSFWNSKEKKIRRRKLAQDTTYAILIDSIENLIKNNKVKE